MSLYSFLKKVFRLQFRVMGWKVHGVENFPKNGPAILVSNHVSVWDPVVAACSVPLEVSFMAKEELFSNVLLGRIFQSLGAFPVKRGQGDTSAIRNSLKVLKEGKVLGLFPEGTRSKSGELQKGFSGMVLLMEKSQAPIVPMRVNGTQNLLTRGWGQIEVIVGTPISPEQLKAPEGVENRREWAADQIMKAIDHLTV
ncbi:1-acyl-sn-glycerol-3-phosphate acyltransferase [Desulfitobacterium dichloroeliminans LMG P-21439]|uniref:1-acyl-sn-glycerol-3-phosphate acyltransferase n=1 Tax=Desulfitobacterium dichloroeliminans (strain LMG P-21439 / DCA1) TaxID=871963 RepID=L0FAS7_DESDL|nr:lysophospholipid acyltransferase family protein [Desulfitobacterium dichloroeliminans]AGA69766.1 1-acyl-sn-glycerol-3-phosphate acyltransferase [Desulfitobacterium dichloroeliminans LMG P-21439]